MKMKQKSQTRQTGAAKTIKDIRRATRKQYSAEENICIVLDGLRGEETIPALCRIEGIAQRIFSPHGSRANLSCCHPRLHLQTCHNNLLIYLKLAL
jgi:transposase